MELAKDQVKLLEYSTKTFAKWAKKQGWETFDRTTASDTTGGQPQRCYANAYAEAVANEDMEMYVGYGIKADLPIPIAHAWTVDGKGSVHDCTPGWGQSLKTEYYGVHIPLEIAKWIHDQGGNPSGINDFFHDLNKALEEMGVEAPAKRTRGEDDAKRLVKPKTAAFADLS